MIFFAGIAKQNGIGSIMVEGGSAILTSCLQDAAQRQLIDVVIVTIAPTFVRWVYMHEHAYEMYLADPIAMQVDWRITSRQHLAHTCTTGITCSGTIISSAASTLLPYFG